MAVRNPFKPTAGASPPQLVGRDSLVEEFMESIENGPGAPGRLTIFTGPRGVGKTVMLNAVGDRVRADYQWLVLDETATPGFLARLTRAALRLLEPETHMRLTGISFPVIGGGVSITQSAEDTRPIDFRETLGALLTQCEARETGVLVTLDEVHGTGKEELSQLAADVQHLIREDREVALAMAGLPSAVHELLNNELTTFLRRADRHELGDVPLDLVARAFEETIVANGRAIAPEALTLAALGTGGYPFMIQLVGYHVWRKAEGNTIDAAAATAGIEQARIRLGALVHGPALRDLSEVDRTFLMAMSHDDGASRLADVAYRMGKSTQYASVYRARLIAAGVIEPTDHGEVDFSLPLMREYLREHAAHLVSPSGRA
jgi:hypothetical protein